MLFYFIILLLYYFFIIFTSCSLENITGLPQARLKSVKATFCVTYVINNLQKHCRQYRPCINKSTLFLLFHFFCQSLFLLNKQLCFSLSVHRTVYQAHKYVVEQIFFFPRMHLVMRVSLQQVHVCFSALPVQHHRQRTDRSMTKTLQG